MSATFLVALIAALLAIIYWRVVLMLVGALIIAMIVTGISSVSGAFAVQEQLPTIIAPEQSGSSSGDMDADPSDEVASPESDPRAQGQPPR